MIIKQKEGFLVTDEHLERILRKTDLSECMTIIDNYIYYCKKPIKTRVSRGDGTYSYSVDDYEFLIITNGEEKQGIILRWGTVDLHWFVLKNWRNQHVLSNALRTGIINVIWPENKTISCCYSWRDKVVDRPKKYAMTEYLAGIAGLKMKE